MGAAASTPDPQEHDSGSTQKGRRRSGRKPSKAGTTSSRKKQAEKRRRQQQVGAHESLSRTSTVSTSSSFSTAASSSSPSNDKQSTLGKTLTEELIGDDSSSQKLMVFYLGPPGTYSHQVALREFMGIHSTVGQSNEGDSPSESGGEDSGSDSDDSASSARSADSSGSDDNDDETADSSAGGSRPSRSIRKTESRPSITTRVKLIPCSTITSTLHSAFTAAGLPIEIKPTKTKRTKGKAAPTAETDPSEGLKKNRYIALMPLENSTHGAVKETAGLLDVFKERIEVIKQVELKVEHALLLSIFTWQHLVKATQAQRRQESMLEESSTSDEGESEESDESGSSVTSNSDSGDGSSSSGQSSASSNGSSDSASDEESASEDEENTSSAGLATRLPAISDTQLGKLQRVWSHEQALGQCAKYLSEHLPLTRKSGGIVPVASTALAASMLASETSVSLTAAVASDICARKDIYPGLRVARRKIQDKDDNTTQFLVIEPVSKPR